MCMGQVLVWMCSNSDPEYARSFQVSLLVRNAAYKGEVQGVYRMQVYLSRFLGATTRDIWV